MTTRTLGMVLVAAIAAPALAGPPQTPLDTAKIEELTGAKGAFDQKEGVFKVTVPRDDLSVTAAGVRLTPPRVMFMHIAGMGNEAQLAAAVGRVFAKIKETSGGKGEVPHVGIDPSKTTLDPRKIDSVLAKVGELKNGVYKLTFGRETRMHGAAMGNTMGVNTWAAFAGSDDKAVVDGDFAMRESELQRVLKALRGAGIDIVAIHQHMSGENPRVLFLHFWGVGSTTSLARGLRAALDTQGNNATGKQ